MLPRMKPTSAPVATKPVVLAILAILAMLPVACQTSPFDGPSRVPQDPDQPTGAGPGAFSDPMVDREAIDDNESDEDPLIGEPSQP